MGKSIQAPTVMPKQTVWLPEIPEGFCPAIIYRAQQAPALIANRTPIQSKLCAWLKGNNKMRPIIAKVTQTKSYFV